MVAQPSETTVSNQVADELKATMVAHLGNYITLPAGFGAGNIHLMSALRLQAAQSPAICIDDQGDTLKTQFAAGVDGDGNVTPGFQLREYRFDVEVWVEGNFERAGVRVNIWRDAICTLLNDYETLDGHWVSVSATGSEPAFEGQIGSKQFWGGVVKCAVVAGTFRGELALANGNPIAGS